MFQVEGKIIDPLSINSWQSVWMAQLQETFILNPLPMVVWLALVITVTICMFQLKCLCSN